MRLTNGLLGLVLAAASACTAGHGNTVSRSAALQAAPGANAEAAPAERPGLGTTFGEAVASPVVERRFERMSSTPFAEIALHYNDARGIEEQARWRGMAIAPVRAATPRGGISVTVVDDAGRALPGLAGADRSYVIGAEGQRYRIAVTNHTSGRYEVVGAIDGRDVVDGRAASWAKRGYVLAPGATLVIDGFRTSFETVAAFRFGRVAASYASRMGDDRNVGVIGLAFFAERGSVWSADELERRETADPFPGRHAAPPIARP